MSILQKDNKILRKVAKKVPLGDIQTSPIQKILKDMTRALHSQEDGVAIAAPQIGTLLRIFIVCDKKINKKSSDKQEVVGKSPEAIRQQRKDHKDIVFINPKIIKLSKEKKMVPEGCLSVRWLYGNVNRSTKATVQAYDEKGNLFQRGGSGILAQIFQHEIDHLDGILFIDKAKDLQEIPPEDQNTKAHEEK